MRRITLKRFAMILGITMLALPFVSFAVTAFFWSQRADYGWSPRVSLPTHADIHPMVVIDEAHNNASTAGIANRYWPFARLLRADGYDVRRGTARFDSLALSNIEILVIANASGANKPQAFGINLPLLGDPDGDQSHDAFTIDEVDAMYRWVVRGGSLLLVADHAPFGASASRLAEAFGIRMFKGYVEVPDESSDPLLFSRDNQRLGDHPIIRGNSAFAGVSRVVTFTGQSLAGPDEAVVLLRLPDNAVEFTLDSGSQEFAPGPAGNAQGLAMSCGAGRIVVLGEAAMLTAQVSGRRPVGMNVPGNDNQQFALNVMRWLSGKLGETRKRHESPAAPSRF